MTEHKINSKNPTKDFTISQLKKKNNRKEKQTTANIFTFMNDERVTKSGVRTMTIQLHIVHIGIIIVHKILTHDNSTIH